MLSSPSLGSVLESIVFQNHAECTSQRVKRTSGARDMINLVHGLSYFHLASWPRLVLFTCGPDLFYWLLAPTSTIYFWPRLQFYLLLAPTSVLFSVGVDLFYFHFGQGQPPSVLPASWNFGLLETTTIFFSLYEKLFIRPSCRITTARWRMKRSAPVLTTIGASRDGVVLPMQ